MEGQILGGRYEVVRELGKGGMGAVYEGRHTGTGRRVAIKVITADLLKSPNLVARFEVEARAAGGIESQHIAQVLDSGRDGETGRPYLVMEYLAGEDLYQAVHRLGPLPVGLVLRIMSQACLGLDKAHRSRIIHRDIKPANIYLNERDGDEIIVKLLDFGIAKIKTEEGQSISDVLTRTGSLLGSPLYMSPEQAKGDKTIDHRSDIWSLGIVMYELLVGRTPYHHIEAFGSLIIAICQEPPAHVTSVAPWVPQEVAAIVHKAISVKPEDRFQSAHEMHKAIKQYLPPGGQAIDKSMFVALTSEERGHRPGPLAALQSGDRSVSQPSFPPSGEQPANAVLASSTPGDLRISSPSAPEQPQRASVPERSRTTAGLTSDPSASTPASKSKLPLAIGAAVVVVAVGAYLALHGGSSPPAPTNAASNPRPAEPAAVTMGPQAAPNPGPAERAPVTAPPPQTAPQPVAPSAAPSAVPTVTPAETTAPATSDSAPAKAAPSAGPNAGQWGRKPQGGKTGPGATTNVGGRIIRTDLP